MKTRNRNKPSQPNGSSSAILEQDLRKLGQELHRYGEGAKTFVHRLPVLKGLKVLVHVDKEPQPKLIITCPQAGQDALWKMRTEIERYASTHVFKNGRIHTPTVESHDHGAVILLR